MGKSTVRDPRCREGVACRLRGLLSFVGRSEQSGCVWLGNVSSISRQVRSALLAAYVVGLGRLEKVSVLGHRVSFTLLGSVSFGYRWLGICWAVGRQACDTFEGGYSVGNGRLRKMSVVGHQTRCAFLERLPSARKCREGVGHRSQSILRYVCATSAHSRRRGNLS